MTDYIEEFRSIFRFHFKPPEEREAAKPRILALVSELESKGYLLGAGLLASQTMSIFCGDWDNMMTLGDLALGLLEKESQETDNALNLAVAHLKQSHVYGQFRLPYRAQNPDLQAKYIHHRRSAAETLADQFVGIPNQDSYLISGFQLLTDFSEQWIPSFVDYEIEEGLFSHSEEFAQLSVPGAFQLFVSISDYKGALEVAKLAPSGFKYPGVCGWREACQGIVMQQKPHQYYQKAAEHFASDICPNDELMKEKPYWSSFHSQILAPYFRARAVLCEPYSSSRDVVEALKRASGEIQPDMSGQVYAPAIRLAILIHGLGSFLETNDESILDRLAQRYHKEMERWGQYAEDDEILLEGLSLVTEAIEGFRYDPVSEITYGRLSRGIRILETIPECSQLQFISSLEDKFGESALEVSQGTTYCDIASALKTITDERVLQRLILQLLQAKGPYHAKVTHGPIELGKDVIAIVDDNGISKLHLYAVKVGDIDARSWPSAKESIDQIFTVSNNNPLVTQIEPSSIHGFLVFNGHFNEYTDPIVDGWLRDLRSRNWNIRIIDLDGLSKWIVSGRLVGVFNRFMDQVG